MPTFSFQARFVMPIITGVKTSTIRRGWKVRGSGAWGLPRCKTGHLIKLLFISEDGFYYDIEDAVCVGVKRIEIGCHPKDKAASYIKIDRLTITADEEYEALAKMEGFESFAEMFGWFDKHYRISEKPFKGWQIRWRSRKPTSDSGDPNE